MNNITKSFGKNTVLKNAAFSFEKNAVNLVIGKNGSGKTTLFKTLYGLIRRFDGELEPCSYKMMSENSVFMKNRSGYENLEYFLEKDEIGGIGEYIDAFSMGDYIHKKVKTYSQGMRKKLALTMILSSVCDAILLDEPTNGLDVPSVMILKSIIAEKKKTTTVIVSSHDSGLFDKSFADAVFIINDKCLKRVEPEREDSTLFIVGTVRPIDETQFTVVDRYNDGSYCIRIMKGEEGDAARALSDYGLVLFKPSDVEEMKAGLIS